MQLKAADDKHPHLEALEGLLARPDLDSRTRKQVTDELWNIRTGERTERDARYEIERTFGESRNYLTIDDLRLDIEGRVAQIDHLIISRILEIWVCESKSFSAGVSINEHGEWSTWRAKHKVGIPSPIEQNRKHIAVLQRAIDLGYVELPRRLGLGLKPRFESVILISKNGSIGRPKAKVAGLEAIVKVDQLETRLLEREVRLRDVPKFLTHESLTEFGRRLVAVHSPHRVDWPARFGLSPTSAAADPATTKPRRSGLKCAQCGEPISYAVAKFCWVNKQRFGGEIYCMPCQELVAPRRSAGS